MSRAWPSELVFSAGKRTLDIRFDDGRDMSIPFETLRVESPSAERHLPRHISIMGNHGRDQ